MKTPLAERVWDMALVPECPRPMMVIMDMLYLGRLNG